MPVHLQYAGKKVAILDAVKMANTILANPEFFDRVALVKTFTNTTYTGEMIAAEMRNFDKPIVLEEYWNPLSRANASSMSKIKINTAKLNRSLSSITNTLIHEAVHVVDWLTNSDFDYTHETNSPGGQGKSAPWVIGDIAEGMVTVKQDSV